MWPFGGGGGGGESSSDAKKIAGSSSSSNSNTSASTAAAGVDQCPVDDKTRRAWLLANRGDGGEEGSKGNSGSSAASSALALLASSQQQQQQQKGGNNDEYEDPVPHGKPANVAPSMLSTERVISSIPRFLGITSGGGDDELRNKEAAGGAKDEKEEEQGNWVYPSPAQFYNAMARKNHDPRAEDMNIVVPIHNAVNERAWKQILEWERLAGGAEACGGPKLVSFQGRPKDVTWKAWWRSLLGYQLPFDRHDWEVDRCGKRVKYVIDFYSGRGNSLSFYLDTRPSPSTLEGCLLRLRMAFHRKEGPPPS